MKTEDYYQQGDVLITRIESMPKKSNKLDHLILQTGEVTGHAHRISKGLAELFEMGTTKYLKVVDKNVILSHEEHNVITLPNGFYKITIVKEYDHFLEEPRNVKD